MLFSIFEVGIRVLGGEKGYMNTKSSNALRLPPSYATSLCQSVWSAAKLLTTTESRRQRRHYLHGTLRKVRGSRRWSSKTQTLIFVWRIGTPQNPAFGDGSFQPSGFKTTITQNTMFGGIRRRNSSTPPAELSVNEETFPSIRIASTMSKCKKQSCLLTNAFNRHEHKSIHNCDSTEVEKRPLRYFHYVPRNNFTAWTQRFSRFLMFTNISYTNPQATEHLHVSEDPSEHFRVHSQGSDSLPLQTENGPKTHQNTLLNLYVRGEN